MELADEACDITLDRNAWCLSARAAALAELGRFDEAIRVQRAALRVCSNSEVVKYRERLRLYEQNQAFRYLPEGDRETWLDLEPVVVPAEEAPVATFDCFRKDRPDEPLDKKVVAEQRVAVVLLESESGFGTGMIVDKRGYVLTCAHVLPYAGPVNVHFRAADNNAAEDLKEEADVIAADHRHDLALLRFEPPANVQLASVRLGVDVPVAAAEDVVTIGNPGVPGVDRFVLQKSVLLGSVANQRQAVGQFIKRPHIQLSADVAPGCSGGPVFNLFGDVIGVVDQQAVIPRTGFAIPMDIVSEFLGI